MLAFIIAAVFYSNTEGQLLHKPEESHKKSNHKSSITFLLLGISANSKFRNFFFLFRKNNFEIFYLISKFLFRNIFYKFRKNNFEIFFLKFRNFYFEIFKFRKIDFRNFLF